MYLGMHGLTGVTGALVLGALYVEAVDWSLGGHHRRRPCRRLDVTSETPHPSSLATAVPEVRART